MPVDVFGGVGVVDDVDGDGLAFLHAEDRAGRRAVVADGGEDAVGGEFDGDGRDAEGDVGRVGGGRWGMVSAWCREALPSARKPGARPRQPGRAGRV